MDREIFNPLEKPRNQPESEPLLKPEANSAPKETIECLEVKTESELSKEQLIQEETSLLQRFRGKARDMAKVFILTTALTSAEFVRPATAFAQEKQKIEQQEKTPEQIKKEQAEKIAARLKEQYLESDLIPENYQDLIKEYQSIEVASFWLARDKAREIMDKIQEEQNIDPKFRTDVMGNEIFFGHTDHLQDIGRNLDEWSVNELANKISQSFREKFTPETMPRDSLKEKSIQSLREKGIDFTENNKFASGKQLQDILEMIEKIENQNPSLMKLKFFNLKHGRGGWGYNDMIYLRSDIFNPNKIMERFKEYPEVQIKWAFTHEMGHTVFDNLSKQEQKQWSELQSEKDFKSMIENYYKGDHRFPEMFSYYFVNREDMIRKIELESDHELKEKLIKQFDFIADKSNGKTFEESLSELNSKQ